MQNRCKPEGQGKTDLWVRSSNNDDLDDTISRIASSTSIWLTCSEKRMRASACAIRRMLSSVRGVVNCVSASFLSDLSALHSPYVKARISSLRVAPAVPAGA